MAKKCDLDVAAGFLHRFAGADGVFGARYQPLSGRVDVQLPGALIVIDVVESVSSGLNPWQHSQKQFGEWGLRWYSPANEKSRERLERPNGLRGAMVETSERPRSRRKAV
ncbi:hypothetical protein LAC81_02120 [Ensifer adhaerens]|uniref:hypothetical protein n=1 Tax=Ensifer adhaerens TaxID=106592 RepID=UPI001CBAA887|nr:hypothetical protein [Ensifer adhaerens]MBZ7920582.1 hypothetical protein [Ensifer adhaerens]UAX93055.1 hypothetical protein LAC78_02115 [Ensifer adhaerens]UAY00691.1 hypothetical protein LAC80_02120 [Ensifer adhaerens]UAY08072.1 hypothetical protein LAC81_02120 [Ensifer adhaerens]